MHLATGHYSTILTEADGKYLLIDRPMQFQGWVTLDALEAQASGYFLIPSDKLRAGWQPVPEEEGYQVYGRDGLHGQQPTGSSVTSDAVMVGGTTPDLLRDPDDWGSDISRRSEPRMCPIGSGMAAYTFHPQVAAVRIQDSPVGYSPPVGPAVFFTVAYNDLDDSKPVSQPQFSNAGRIWSINWVAYVDHVSGSLYDGIQVKVHLSGGGVEVSSYSGTTGVFGPNDRSFATVVRSGSYTYTRIFPDGSKEVYNSPDNVSAPNRVFLTQRIDASGNVISFNYDSQMRLTAVTDAIGRVTTLEYNLPSDIWKVTKVTDPFGRYATLTYNATTNLASITDVIGLTSSFTYGADEFTATMTTPYGTNNFAKVQGSYSWDRTVTVTDPQGDQERVQYIEPIEIPGNEPPLPTNIVVAGVNVPFVAETGRLQFRNSFYWSKEAMKVAPGDTSAARNYRWFTDVNYLVTPVLEATKESFESRVWFNYPSQGVDDRLFSYYAGLGALPEKTLRILDDGTPQLTQTYYNPLGRITNAVDPLGRTTIFNYAANYIDLLEIRQLTGAGTSDRLASFTYNAQHLPLTVVDATGQRTTFTYNAAGQLLTLTNPKGETTTLSYDANGFLISIDGPLPGPSDTTSFTYDGTNRVRTVTDSDGYTLTFDYDALDRLTNITFPDGTYEQFTYNRLDRTVARDRLGRQTFYTYNSLQQLVQVQDALNRIVRFDWCRCGGLGSISDPLGRTTTWLRDVQGRVTAKQYADGSQISYSYERNSGRLKTATDEKGQVTQYQYNLDDNVAQVSYSNAVVATPSVSFSYDPIYSRVASMTDGMGVTTYSYNPLPAGPTLGAGRLAAIDGPLPNDTITYQYDELGRITNRAINGVAAAVTFDTLGRVAGLTNALGAFTYTYDGISRRLASLSYPNGQSSTFTYYSNLGDRRLQQITHMLGATPISQFGYAYNAMGVITNWTQQSGVAVPKVYSLGYDAVYQLLSAVVTESGTNVSVYAYTYDAAGNRTSEQTNGIMRQFFYNSLDEITTSSAGSASVMTIEWDAAQRLTAINQGTNRTGFTYDGLGRRTRIIETSGGAVVSSKSFVWCGRDVCEERDAAGTVVTKRFVGQGVRVGSADIYYTKDHLGSIHELIDSAGVIRAAYEYAPYGRRIKISGNSDADWAFAGQYNHVSSGLLLATFRAYDPELGRWISRDPIAEAGGLNVFKYVFNNPVGLVDPIGLCPYINRSAGFNVELSGVVGFGLFGLPGFLSWGTAVGFNMHGQLVLQSRISYLAGVGAFVGAGLSPGAFVNRSPEPLPLLDTAVSLRGEFNMGAGPAAGYSADVSPEGLGSSIPEWLMHGVGAAALAKPFFGVGEGIMIGVGPSWTTTLAMPIPTDSQIEQWILWGSKGRP
jgi:RHS repeat-associated protein